MPPACLIYDNKTAYFSKILNTPEVSQLFSYRRKRVSRNLANGRISPVVLKKGERTSRGQSGRRARTGDGGTVGCRRD